MIVFQEVGGGCVFVCVCMCAGLVSGPGWCSGFDKCTISDLQRSIRGTVCSWLILERQEQVCKGMVGSPLFYYSFLYSVSPFFSSVTSQLSPSVCHARLLISSLSAGNLIKVASRFLPHLTHIIVSVSCAGSAFSVFPTLFVRVLNLS